MLFFLLVFFHDGFEFIKSVVPHFPEWFEEVGDFFHFMRVEVVEYFSAIMLLIEEVAFGEDLDVFGDGLPGGVEVFGDGGGCHGLDGEEGKDCPAGGVGNGLKYVAAEVHFMQLFDCKYIRSHLTAQIFVWVLGGLGLAERV